MFRAFFLIFQYRKQFQAKSLFYLFKLPLILSVCNFKKSDCESAAIRCQHSSTGISCKTERFFFSVRTHSSVVCQCDSPLFGRREKTVETSLALAILIAFSRMYLYVHYPTDILSGVIFGSLSAWIGYQCSKMFNIFQVERP